MNRWQARAEVYEEMAANCQQTYLELLGIDSLAADTVLDTAKSFKACADMMRQWATEEPTPTMGERS